jgi:urea transport system substrate-binding protein
MSSEPFESAPTVRREPVQPLSGDTVGAGTGNSDAAGTAETLTSFLAAPQSPDELGWLAHYRVLKLLGRGGMGAVFQAEDTHLQRVVALKVILPESAADLAARERFLREARACAALKNDHVITIYQVGQDRDMPFLAMEFLQGQALADRLRLGGPLPVAEILRIGRQVADGLAAAHAQGLIHRDIKPANVWLETQAAGPPRVKLLDFGLARAAGARSGLTYTGDIVGTPQFMSPEQARGKELDPRSDLFSLGAVLYRMCSGRKPFHGDTVMAVLTALAVDTPRPLHELNAGLPPALVELVRRLLEKDPANRPASAAEVRDALAAVEAGEGPTTVIRPRAEAQAAAHQPTVVAIEPAPPRRRRPLWLVPVAGLAAGVLLGGIGLLAGWFTPHPHGGAAPAVLSGPPIKVGILHPLSGTMANDGPALIDATQLAVEEINAGGGLLGRPVQAIVRDTQSDPDISASEAEKLIVQDKVCTVFGIWLSASRKTVKPVFEKHDHLLVYPLQYEGMEQSPNIVYNGATPNQQIIPAVKYCFGFLNKRRFFLVGSDYIFPRAANAVIRDELKALGGQVVGEAYLPLGSGEVGDVVRQIVAARPDVILNTINGDSNRAFFRALRARDGKSGRILTVSFSLSEHEIRSLPLKETLGDYAAWSYFQNIDRPQNHTFVKRFRAKYGAQRVVSDPMEAAYYGVHLWAQAVTAAGTDDVRAIRAALKGQRYEAPEGPVRIDPKTLHTWKTVRLGKVVEGGRLEIVWSSETPIRPEPYPSTRSRAEWNAFLDDLHKRWGERWFNPGP